MNEFAKRMIIMFGPMILRSIIDSMLNEKALTEYRDKMVAYFREMCGKTKNQIDDAAVEAFIGLLMDPTVYTGQTLAVCELARGYIKSTETEWDDFVFLPILDRIQKLGTGE